MSKRNARPRPQPRQPRRETELRFFVEGAQVDQQAFWEAVRELGGQAVVSTHPPAPPRGELRYRLTPAGVAALARGQR